jgi:hypothetical protein
VQYKIYNPTIETTTIVDPYDNAAGLTYVSNSSMAYYGRKYWAIMDGNVGGFNENDAGQQIWATTSNDATTWATPFQPFRNATYCNNPITGTALEWQPNLVVVGTELWCTWSITGAPSVGYISKLTTPTGKWTNYRFEFSGTDVLMSTTITGSATGGRSLAVSRSGITDYAPFFSQNPIVLSTGTVACPLTFQSATQSTQTTATSAFTKSIKFNAILKTANGIDWTLTAIDTSDFGDFCAWEPFVVEDPAGHVYGYSRNLDARAADKDFMLVAVSTDYADTFSPSVSSKMLVPSTRGFARRISRKRWLMVHNDRSQRSDRTPNQALSRDARRNGALFFSRRGANDFVPGVNFSGDELSVNYPQMINVGSNVLVHWTSNTGGAIRRSMKLARFAAPSDEFAHIYPRSVTTYDPVTPIDPKLVSGPPSYYLFNGVNQSRSATSLTASTGVTYAAWLRWDYDGSLIMDSRQAGTSEAFGQVLFTGGLSINGINFLHGQELLPAKPTFLAASIDNAAGSVTVYFSNSSSLTTIVGYFKSILFTGQPPDGDTVAVNGVTYTFRNSASTSSEIAIGATLQATVFNFVTKLNASAMTAVFPNSGNRVIACRTDRASFAAVSGSAQITVESALPLDGGQVSFGRPATPSGLAPYAGRMYDARVYDSALSVANITYLHNAQATGLGKSAIAGTSTAPGSALIHFNPASPDLEDFPSLGTPGRCEINGPTLQIYGDESAAVDLPYGATEITVRYRLGATPTATDKYTIATFGTVDFPARLYIDSANPTKLYCNGREVSTVSNPTSYNTLKLTVSTNKISIGTFEQVFAGKPRCLLGNGYPESLLSSSKYVEFDTSLMTAVRRLSQ